MNDPLRPPTQHPINCMNIKQKSTDWKKRVKEQEIDTIFETWEKSDRKKEKKKQMKKWLNCKTQVY